MSADKKTVAVSPKVSNANNMIIRGYHRTKSKDSPQSIAYLGFDSKLSEKITNNDPLYGPGFYLTRNLIDHLKPHYNQHYGEVIIQNDINMEGVLIFDLALSVKVFGQPKTILQQFIDREIKVEYLEHLLEIEAASNTCVSHKYTADQAKRLYSLGIIDITKWAGMAYTGRQDGACVVMYKTNQVFPRIWAHYDFKELENLYNEENSGLIKAKSKYDDDDLEDDEDDEDYKYDDSLKEANNKKVHYIVSKLLWNKLNAREVNKIRSGFDTRFCRWIEKFSKLPVEKASDRFNQCLTRLEDFNVKSFLAECQKYSEKSLDAKKFVNYLLEKAPDAGLIALMHKFDPNFDVMVSFKSNLFKFKEAGESAFWKEVAKPIFYQHIERFVEIRANAIRDNLQKEIANYVNYLSTLSNEVLYDSIYDFCNSVKRTSPYDHITGGIKSAYNILSILSSLANPPAKYVRGKRFYPKKILIDFDLEKLRELVKNKEKEIDSLITRFMFDLIRDPRVFDRVDVVYLVLSNTNYDETLMYKKRSNKIISPIEFQDVEPEIDGGFEPPKFSKADLQAMLLEKKSKVKSKAKTKKAASTWDDDEDD